MDMGQKIRNRPEPRGGGGQDISARKAAKMYGAHPKGRENEIRGEAKTGAGEGDSVRGG